MSEVIPFLPCLAFLQVFGLVAAALGGLAAVAGTAYSIVSGEELKRKQKEAADKAAREQGALDAASEEKRLADLRIENDVAGRALQSSLLARADEESKAQTLRGILLAVAAGAGGLLLWRSMKKGK